MDENPEKSLDDQEIRRIKTQYNKAKDVLENILGLNSKYEATQTLLKGREEEIEKLATDAREKLTSVDNSRTESAALVSEIKGHLEKVQTSITSLEEGMQKFENIRGKIEAKDGEIEALVAIANSLKQDIENSKASAQQRLSDIEGALGQVQEKITKIQEAYDLFAGLNAKISDENTGLQAVLNETLELQKKTKAVIQEISSFRDEARSALNDIQASQVEAERLKDVISEHLTQSEAAKVQISEITDLITDTGFANAFQEREKKLFWGSMLWFAVFVASTAGLAALLYQYLFVGHTETIPDPAVVLYRLTLTSPILLLIGFAIAQYRNDRMLTERYAFKAIIATVIRNHSRFLTDLNKDSTPETELFARDAIVNVYKEPYGKYSQNRKQSNKKLNLKEMVESTKELRELVPNDDSLQAIISLLTKLR